jgi:uracil-DNA glycosylase family 4
MFVGEAPGRLGADRTGIPFYGDRTGDNFENLLLNVSWQREDLFITNALLCNPREDTGNNGTPSAAEIKNCSMYLSMLLELIRPEVVVSLGAKALEALKHVQPHIAVLKQDVGKAIPWHGAILVPLYHPGPRATLHRSLIKQRSDFMVLAKLVDPRRGLRPANKQANRQKASALSNFEPSQFQKALGALLEMSGCISYFKAAKLLYLAELRCIERLGRGLTGEIFIRQVDGPWPPAMRAELSAMLGTDVEKRISGQRLLVLPGQGTRFETDLPDEELDVIAEIVQEYASLPESRLKTIAYLTTPMRRLLRWEKEGKDMRNTPLIYKGQICQVNEPLE